MNSFIIYTIPLNLLLFQGHQDDFNLETLRHQLYSTLAEFSARTGLNNNVLVRTCIVKQFNVKCHVPVQFLTSKVQFWPEENTAYFKFPLTLFGYDPKGKVFHVASFGPLSNLYSSNSITHLNSLKLSRLHCLNVWWDLEEDYIQANDSEIWESTKRKEEFSAF